MIENDKKVVQELINGLTLGIQYELIGDEDIATGITLFEILTGSEEDVLPSQIIVNVHGRYTFLNFKNNVLKNIIRFNPPLIEQLNDGLDEGKRYNGTDLFNLIKNKLNNRNIKFFQLFSSIIGLQTDYFFPIKEIKELNIDPNQEPKFKLHSFQKNIKDRSVSYLLNPDNTNRHLLHLPTGAGKTKTAMEIITDFIRSHATISGFNSQATIIWIAHSTELCEQAFETFFLTWLLRGDDVVNTVKFYDKFKLRDQFDPKLTNIVFMGFGKIVAALKSDGPERDILKDIKERTDLVIIDEAHRSIAPEWNKAIEYFASNSSTQMIGLTATPGLGSGLADDARLASYFHFDKICLSDNNQVTISDPIKYLRELGYLANIDNKEILTNYELKISSDDIANYKISDKRLRGILKDASLDPKRNKLLIDEIVNEYTKGRKTLIFACSLSHCTIIKSILNTIGINSETITSKQVLDRNKIIEQFKNEDLNILINYGVLTTGFDAPQINTVIIARPTFSIVLYSQMVGRALRGPKNGGNERNKLITLKDNLLHGDMNNLFKYFETVWK